MTDRHAAARAAFEAALAATSSEAVAGHRPTVAPRRPEAWQPIPGDPESDLQSRDAEPDAHDVARQIVLRQLAMAPRSRQQLRDKLKQRECPDDVAEAVLDRMTEVGLIDDEAFAGMLVRSQQAGRGLAKRALARELRTKGVDDETARATLDAIDPHAERDQAERLVAKKLRSMHGLDVLVQKRRLAGMLARKGYPADLSMSVIREALAEAAEHRRD
ncbi:regulatory protein RecX [Phycicoccus sp. Soil748]|uniref:regulatory protein RecX n=1 Tax=Intrasporangiaceae TaxID=85021 RepID=UPI0009E7F33F|nr:regulatory protein RecX [Phycicoccus sp. Soil748]